MEATDATFGKFKAGKYTSIILAKELLGLYLAMTALTFFALCLGNVDIVIDDIAKVAKAAGDRIMEIYNAPDFAEKIIDPKADGSPLTVADLEANRIIVDGLKELYPSIPIITEESKVAPYETRKDWEYFFCVDPLDGTKEFIKRNGQFTVNIGLVEKESPIAGVVYCPALDPPVMYKGNKFNADGSTGGPPVKEECDAVGGAAGYDSFKAIFPKKFSEEDENLILVASSSHNTPETDAFCAKYKNHKRIERGSSLKLLMVAEGNAHIYPRFAGTYEWDTCAAQAIVECAGGKVLQKAGNPELEECEPEKPVKYNKENLKNPFFVVYGNVVIRPKKAKKKKEVAFGEESKSGHPFTNPIVIVLVLLIAIGVGFLVMQ